MSSIHTLTKGQAIAIEVKHFEAPTIVKIVPVPERWIILCADYDNDNSVRRSLDRRFYWNWVTILAILCAQF